MIIGVGIDHARIDRVRDLIDRHPVRARERLFTDAERRACEGRQRVPECYAARFAAKEAFVKALGTGLREGIRWIDVEVATDETGRPELVLHGAAAEIFERVEGGRVHLSFTHEGGIAAAVVVIEADSPRR